MASDARLRGFCWMLGIGLCWLGGDPNRWLSRRESAERCRWCPLMSPTRHRSRRCSQLAVSAFGRVDVLFNNAGVFGPSAAVGEIDDEQWHCHLAHQCRRCAVLRSRSCPRDVGASAKGRKDHQQWLVVRAPSTPRSVAYTVTKHAISGLTASMPLDLRDIDICVTQIDIGNAATIMTAGIGHQTLQADGSLAAEPTFDVTHVARAVAHLVELPLEVSVPSLTVMARAMPYFGRG